MKKFFENPKMELSMFHAENIVTVSGVATGEKTDSTAEVLQSQGYHVQNISVSGVEFTF